MTKQESTAMIDKFVSAMTTAGASEHTTRVYRRVLVQIAKMGHSWQDLDQPKLVQFLEGRLAEGRSIYVYVTAMRRFARWAINEQLLTRDPTYSLVPHKIGRQDEGK